MTTKILVASSNKVFFLLILHAHWWLDPALLQLFSIQEQGDNIASIKDIGILILKGKGK